MSNQSENTSFNDFVDPAEMWSMVGQVNQQYQRLIEQLVNRKGVSDPSLSVLFNMTETFQKLNEQLAVNPLALFDEQMALWQGQMQLWQNTARQMLGEKVEPIIEPARDDRRFIDPEWNDNLLFDFIKQSYLLFARCMLNVIHSAQGMDEKSSQNLDFYARQFVNAMSPSNFVATNPEVLRKTLATRGQNLVKGMEQLIEDMQRSSEGLNISMTDFSAFELGKNVATTPGKVVFQNDMIQLIQYQPTTEKTFKTPLLIVPPWINKFYILDLRESNSMVKWMLDQGHTVFIISWVNPGPAQAQKGWADYMKEGPLAAMDAIEQATGEKSVNVISYCIGGTLTASTMAYLAAKKQANRVNSVTYMATLQDFTDPGEIGVFINEATLKGIEKQLDRDGYLDGRAMAMSFNMLRENDLFWSFFINNYLKGERPQAFDLLYWNCDSTNMPAEMHKFYLRNMYVENNLIQGKIELDGVKIELGNIKTPAYFVSTIQDHIAKWTSTYGGARAHGGPVKFVLSGSGHIAGIVNPPNKKKYGHWTNDKLPETPDAWFAGAQKNEGSWWPNWQEWVTSNKYANPETMVDAREPGTGKLKALEDAPGSFVKTKIPEVIAAAEKAKEAESTEAK